ncbi:MAG: hypothetical protein ABIO55_06050 [Ginsengibacter sp.]
MKLKLFNIPSLFLLSIVLIVASCTKEGPAGATGPAGPGGPQGPTGAAGVNGPAGPAGTANVIYSDWIDTTTWQPDIVITGTVMDTIGFFAVINAPKLDLTMLNTGEMKVYVNVNSTANPVVYPLPYNNGLFIDVLFYLNSIQLYSNGDLTDVPFRYILIPGGTKSGRGINGVPGTTINWSDYKQVKAYLGLKD